ncbi:MAG: hypothetical protein R2813_04345 [Flavobacteriales bacterium]
MRSLFALILLFAIGSCDPCKDVSCDHGICVDGGCKCELGYVGDQCELQNKPEAIIITSVHIENVPSTVLGAKWDNDTTSKKAFLPDVMLQVRFGTSQDEAFNSIETYYDNELNSFTFKEGMKIRVPDIFPELRFTLADLDYDQRVPMYAIIAVGYYDPVGGFPEEFQMTNEDGATLLMKMSYEH